MKVLITLGVLMRVTCRITRIWLRLMKVQRNLAGIQRKVEQLRVELRPLAVRALIHQ
jgi:hypothetical protein